MPRETGADGKQIQLPKAAAITFFGLQDRIGASKVIYLAMTDGFVKEPAVATRENFDVRTYDAAGLEQLKLQDGVLGGESHQAAEASGRTAWGSTVIALPASQRSLIILVLRKLLASSTFAIATTLRRLVARLDRLVRQPTS